MKIPATLKLNGKEIELEITEEEVKKLLESSEKPKKTGYERVKHGEIYYLMDSRDIDFNKEGFDDIDQSYYDTANYHSDRTVAENNARADTLKRKLRRFVVERREEELNWHYPNQNKWCIEYYHDNNEFCVDWRTSYQGLGEIYFDTEKTAKAAIEEFKDELIWYFTEYKDSL